MASQRVKLICLVLDFERAKKNWESERKKCDHFRKNVHISHHCAFYRDHYRGCLIADCPMVADHKERAKIQDALIREELATLQKKTVRG